MLLTASNKVRHIAGTLSRLAPKRVLVTFGESKRVLCFFEEDKAVKLRQLPPSFLRFPVR